MIRSILPAACAACLLSPAWAQAHFESFTVGPDDSSAAAVSADGVYVAGVLAGDIVRRDHSGAITPLGSPPGDPTVMRISADGSALCGSYFPPGSNLSRSWLWQEGIGFSLLAGSDTSWANGVSGDGSVVTGWRIFPNGTEHAYRWTLAGGFQDLGVLPGALPIDPSAALDINDAADVIVGHSASPSGMQAFRWTPAGMVGLGFLPGQSSPSSIARAVNGTGDVVVGYASTTPLGVLAFRWTPSTGMVALGNHPGNSGADASLAFCTNGDGSLIGGEARTATGMMEAMVFSDSMGMQSADEFLSGQGVPGLADWTLLRVTGISRDGSVLCGTGILTGSGQEQGWVAYVPRPDLGLRGCVQAVPNSTGRIGKILASCSSIAAANQFKLSAGRLPANQFGMFLTSRSAADIPVMNSGVLCLGAPIGRQTASLQSSGSDGTLLYPLDLTAIQMPGANASASIGDTWHFQAWHRDVGGTSNFTDSVTLTFH